MGTAIEYFCDRAERLLSGSVPYLKFQDFVLHSDKVGTEFDADSDIMVLFELILDQSFQHTRLPDAYIRETYHLDEFGLI